MDADRFDTLTRIASTAGSRRLALAVALGGTLGALLDLTHSDVAAAGGKCKPKCGQCQRCKKGNCKKTKHGKVCKKGTCRAKDTGTPCDGGACESGNCVAALVLNRFGCVDVGQACRGDDGVCCSGRCEGEAPTAGVPDTSRCVAHDTGSCQPGQAECGPNSSCTTSTGFTGTCNRTTGNALYCSSVTPACQPCAKDAECVASLGATAACVIPCPGSCAETTGGQCTGNLED